MSKGRPLITELSEEWDEFNDKVAAAANKKRSSEAAIGDDNASKNSVVTTGDGTVSERSRAHGGRRAAGRSRHNL
jgi:hypothetical protein